MGERIGEEWETDVITAGRRECDERGITGGVAEEICLGVALEMYV